MGFGRGIDSEARRGAVIGARKGWPTAPPGGRTRYTDLVVAVPAGTAAPIDLGALTTPAARDEHARKLALPAGGTGINAQRDLVGDARDLLVDVLRHALPAPGAANGVSIAHAIAPSKGYRSILVVHVGPTEVARALLRAIRRGDPEWEGDLDALDGDGYVNLLVDVPPGRLDGVREGPHLILAGGSGYGTYFAVSTFLQKQVGARWLFPGDDGTLIPRLAEFALGAVDEFEEPAVRSRTLAAISSESVHTAAELDEIRAWQLRNRLRPHDDLARLFQRARRNTDPCGRPRDVPGADGGFEERGEFVAAALEVEDRVPNDHMLHNFLSPYRSAPGSITPRVDGPGVDHYPELRHRHARLLAVPGASGLPIIVTATGNRLDGERLHNELGALGDTVTFTEAPDPCDGAVRCCAEPTPDGARTVLRVAGGPTGLVANYATALGDNFSHRILSVAPTGDPLRAAPDVLARFIPRAFTRHLTGDLVPFANWHPCIFDYDATPLGAPKRPRLRLVDDVATQLAVSLVGRRLRGRDPTHSAAFDDLDTWCQCDACLRVDDDGGPGNDLTLYQGYLVARPSIALEREAGFDVAAGAGALNAAALAARTAWLRDGLGGMRGGSFEWEARPANNPFAGLSFDALAACGVVWSQGYPRTRTRRVLTLLNAVCSRVGALLDVGYGGAPSALGVVSPPEAAPPPVLGFHAYAQYMAPPMVVPTGAPRTGESCHPFLMPYLTGVRDTIEYAPGATNPYESAALPASTEGALGRLLVAPDQFNHERWSRLARRTGLYEYITSAGYVGPHLYSARLHAAIRRGLRHHRLRGFISETTPNWCFDAPMLWELPRLLWDPGPLGAAEAPGHLGALRREFCQHAFGPAWAPMAVFFDLCEEAWAATRDGWKVYDPAAPEGRPYPDRRLRTGAASGLCGDGYGGRGAMITTLDGFLGEPPVNGGRNRLRTCWWLLNRAYEASAGHEPSRRRVQLFRRGFGLTLLIGLWYEPVQKAFEMIRRRRDDLVQMRKMTVAKDTVMYERSEMRLTQSNVRDTNGVLQTVTLLTEYSDQHPSEPRLNIPPRTPPAALSAADRALRDAAAARINPPGSPINGLRSLRNQVHRYLALSHNEGATEAFPTFQQAGLAPDEHVRDVGLGLFPGGSGSLADDAPFPNGPIAGPHRLVGLDLPYLTQYIDWWNAIPRDGNERARAEAMDERIRLLSHVTTNPGFGWCFQGIRQAAGMVAVHGYDAMIPMERARRLELLFHIVRG